MNGVRFSIFRHVAWAPGVTDSQAWSDWADAPFAISADEQPRVPDMPPMLRRRAGFPGKMALEVAYQCLEGRTGIPTVFCSRHGEVGRALELLNELIQGQPVSPTGFGLAVHNASAGLFSIARADQANHIALAAGDSTIEHGVIEACALLADGAPLVLLVAYDTCLPEVFSQFEDVHEQAHAWAWLMAPAEENVIHLNWSAGTAAANAAPDAMPAGLQVLRFQLAGHQRLERLAGPRRWCWSRDA